jgi:hypothetical protein
MRPGIKARSIYCRSCDERWSNHSLFLRRFFAPSRAIRALLTRSVIINGDDQKRFDYGPGCVVIDDDNSPWVQRDKVSMWDRQHLAIGQAKLKWLKGLLVECFPNTADVHDLYLRPDDYLSPFVQSRRPRELGMFIALRYLVTVRRATVMPALPSSSTIASSDIGLVLSSLSMIS